MVNREEKIDMHSLNESTQQLEVLESEDKSTQELPPRTLNPKVIARVLYKKPVKVEYGFCGMCDSSLRNEWVLGKKRPQCELRHLADVGTLRISEVDILINALESGELDDFWIDGSHIQDADLLAKSDTQKSFIDTIILSLHRIFILICWFLEGLSLFAAKHNWHRSRKGNMYNPTIGVTVYRWRDYWKIARDGEYFGTFDTRREAMDVVFEIWLKEREQGKRIGTREGLSMLMWLVFIGGFLYCFFTSWNERNESFDKAWDKRSADFQRETQRFNEDMEESPEKLSEKFDALSKQNKDKEDMEENSTDFQRMGQRLMKRLHEGMEESPEKSSENDAWSKQIEERMNATAQRQQSSEK
ncbi:MAG: hypothetical protein WCG04_00990 [Alphaproteobacteria bacterium]